jgi:hypothetical protein
VYCVWRPGHFQVAPAVLEVLQGMMAGGWASEAQCEQTIADVHARTGYLLDPHTAVAKCVVDALPPPAGTEAAAAEGGRGCVWAVMSPPRPLAHLLTPPPPPTHTQFVVEWDSPRYVCSRHGIDV